MDDKGGQSIEVTVPAAIKGTASTRAGTVAGLARAEAAAEVLEQAEAAAVARAKARAGATEVPMSKTARGTMFETRACDHLTARGLRLLARNVRLCGGEIDLIMADDRRGEVVFVEVRARASMRFGGAAASIDWRKRQRIRRAAAAWMMRWPTSTPPCRFDVVAIDADRVQWLAAAFDETD